MQDANVTYEELVPDYEFSPVNYDLSEPLISKYLQAVDISDGGFVPPMAIAAYSLQAMAGALSLPPDAIAIHTSQEIEFFKLVPVGATIECHAKVARKITRASMRMLVLELNVFNQDKEKVQSGKTTIVFPG